jgi:hypothetical protein
MQARALRKGRLDAKVTAVAVRQPNVEPEPPKNVGGDPEGSKMAHQISPKFHAEIIVVLFDEYRDLRKVRDRVGVLLSDASAEHIESVGKYLPSDLMRVLPRKILHAA